MFKPCSISPTQLAVVRVLLGLYLLVHYLYLIPYAEELFSDDGVLPLAAMSSGIHPLNPLSIWSTGNFAVALISMAALVAFVFMLGFWTRVSAFLLWLFSAFFIDRNHYTDNPAVAMVGLVLLAYAVSSKDDYDDLHLPKWFYTGVWAVIAVAYSVSGFEKLQSPSWQEGEAVTHMLSNPLARDYFLREWILKLPAWCLAIATWGAIAVELLFAPLAIFSKTRRYVWLAVLLMHMGIFLVLDIADITIGLLVVHIFLFQSEWVKSMRESTSLEKPVIFFDGVCGLCNRFIKFVISRDRRRVFMLSTLQGDYAKNVLASQDIEGFKSVIVLTPEGKVLKESEAVFYILAKLKTPEVLVSIVGKLLPSKLADLAYREVAIRRYKIFGTLDACTVPTLDERARFLN